MLSIYQTDIIIYGTDLAEYIISDFKGWFISEDWTGPPMVPFWSEFLRPQDLRKPATGH